MTIMQYRGLLERRWLTLSACWLAGLFMMASVQAETYHVASGGSDANNGLTEETAWATLQHAADQVQAGDTVLVHDGTYTGFQMETSGTEDNPIVFKAASSNVIINEVNPVRGKDIINVGSFSISRGKLENSKM